MQKTPRRVRSGRTASNSVRKIRDDMILDVKYCDHLRKMGRLVIGKEQCENSFKIKFVDPRGQ
jgi:hypothetical protein